MAPLRIRLSEPLLVDDLVEFLRRREYLAEEAGEGVVEVGIARSLRHDALRLEVDLLLRAWEARHPGADAAVID